MGNFFPTTKDLEFWHRREQMPEKMHKSTGKATAYDNIVEYYGEACSFEEGNDSGGLNFEPYEIVSIERYTRRNIFIDRIKGTAEITAALVENSDGIKLATRGIRVTLPNDQSDVGKCTLFDEYKNELAVFYIEK